MILLLSVLTIQRNQFSQYFNNTVNILTEEQLQLHEEKAEACGYTELCRQSLFHPPAGKISLPNMLTSEGTYRHVFKHYKRNLALSLDDTRISIAQYGGCNPVEALFDIIEQQNPWY